MVQLEIVQFDKQVKFVAAFDRRHPDPAQDYGIHGVDALFTLAGEKGAIRFVLFTSWHFDVNRADAPMPAQVEVHSKGDHWGTAQHADDCDILGGECWYKCYFNLAQEAYNALVNYGDDGLWSWMECRYNVEFERAS